MAYQSADLEEAGSGTSSRLAAVKLFYDTCSSPTWITREGIAGLSGAAEVDYASSPFALDAVKIDQSLWDFGSHLATFETPAEVFLDSPVQTTQEKYRFQCPCGCRMSFRKPANVERHCKIYHHRYQDEQESSPKPWSSLKTFLSYVCEARKNLSFRRNRRASFVVKLGSRSKDKTWAVHRQQMRHRSHRDYWISTKGNTTLNLGSALGMCGTYLWLNDGTSNPKSSSVTWVTNFFFKHIPIMAREILQHVPVGVIFAGFVIATGIFTGTVFASASRIKHRTQIAFSSLSFGLSMLLWLWIRVRYDELFLICLPLSISSGILGSCLDNRDDSYDIILDEE